MTNTKSTTITVESVENIKEVKTTWDEKEANSLLATKRWIIMHAGVAHKGQGGFEAKPCFVLARVK